MADPAPNSSPEIQDREHGFRLLMELQENGRLDEAQLLVGELRARFGDGSELDYREGLNHFMAGRFGESIELVRRRCLEPDAEGVHWTNLGVALRQAGRPEEAIEAFREAVRRSPDYVKPYKELAVAALAVQRRDLAAEAMKALALHALARGAGPVAVDAFENLIRVNPEEVWAIRNLANFRRLDNRNAEAEALFRRVLELKPDDLVTRLALAVNKLPLVYASEQHVRDVRAGFEATLRDFAAAVDGATEAQLAEAQGLVGDFKPYMLGYQGFNERPFQELYGRALTRIMSPLQARLPAPRGGEGGGRVRVGFAGGYFFRHTVGKLFRGWWEQLDRSRFEVFGYNFNPGEGDEVTRAARAALGANFREEKRRISDWAAVILEDRLDVLIYPEIGMHPLSIVLAALKLAPVQCVSFGHPMTTGLPAMDYVLSAEMFEAMDAQEEYTEALVRLPGIALSYEPPFPKGGTRARADFGLPEDRTVLLCCQSLMKYHPAHDELLARISQAVPESYLVLIGHDDAPAVKVLTARLQAAFAARDMAWEERGRFVPPVAPDRFADFLASGDVYLDTLGWSGGNTTLEAITCDLPVVTIAGPRMRGRVTAGMLALLDLRELVALGPEDYVAIAVRLARDPAYRASVVERVKARKATLFGRKDGLRALEGFLERVARQG